MSTSTKKVQKTQFTTPLKKKGTKKTIAFITALLLGISDTVKKLTEKMKVTLHKVIAKSNKQILFNAAQLYNCSFPLTAKPLQSRMGKGKAKVKCVIAPITKGSITYHANSLQVKGKLTKVFLTQVKKQKTVYKLSKQHNYSSFDRIADKKLTVYSVKRTYSTSRQEVIKKVQKLNYTPHDWLDGLLFDIAVLIAEAIIEWMSKEDHEKKTDTVEKKPDTVEKKPDSAVYDKLVAFCSKETINIIKGALKDLIEKTTNVFFNIFSGKLFISMSKKLLTVFPITKTTELERLSQIISIILLPFSFVFVKVVINKIRKNWVFFKVSNKILNINKYLTQIEDYFNKKSFSKKVFGKTLQKDLQIYQKKAIISIEKLKTQQKHLENKNLAQNTKEYFIFINEIMMPIKKSSKTVLKEKMRTLPQICSQEILPIIYTNKLIRNIKKAYNIQQDLKDNFTVIQSNPQVNTKYQGTMNMLRISQILTNMLKNDIPFPNKKSYHKKSQNRINAWVKNHILLSKKVLKKIFFQTAFYKTVATTPKAYKTFPSTIRLYQEKLTGIEETHVIINNNLKNIAFYTAVVNEKNQKRLNFLASSDKVLYKTYSEIYYKITKVQLTLSQYYIINTPRVIPHKTHYEAKSIWQETYLKKFSRFHEPHYQTPLLHYYEYVCYFSEYSNMYFRELRHNFIDNPLLITDYFILDNGAKHHLINVSFRFYKTMSITEIVSFNHAWQKYQTRAAKDRAYIPSPDMHDFYELFDPWPRMCRSLSIKCIRLKNFRKPGLASVKIRLFRKNLNKNLQIFDDNYMVFKCFVQTEVFGFFIKVLPVTQDFAISYYITRYDPRELAFGIESEMGLSSWLNDPVRHRYDYVGYFPEDPEHEENQMCDEETVEEDFDDLVVSDVITDSEQLEQCTNYEEEEVHPQNPHEHIMWEDDFFEINIYHIEERYIMTSREPNERALFDRRMDLIRNQYGQIYQLNESLWKLTEIRPYRHNLYAFKESLPNLIKNHKKQNAHERVGIRLREFHRKLIKTPYVKKTHKPVNVREENKEHLLRTKKYNGKRSRKMAAFYEKLEEDICETDHDIVSHFKLQTSMIAIRDQDQQILGYTRYHRFMTDTGNKRELILYDVNRILMGYCRADVTTQKVGYYDRANDLLYTTKVDHFGLLKFMNKLRLKNNN